MSVLVPVYVDSCYSYRVPVDSPSLFEADKEGGFDGRLEPGQLVRVPLGPRSVLGVVWDDPSEFSDEARLKDIQEVYEGVRLSDDFRKFVDWIAHYTLAQRGMVLRMVLRGEDALLPPRPVAALRLTGEPPERMTNARARVLEAMEGGLAETKSAIAERAGVSASVVDGLVKSGTLSSCMLPPPALMEPPQAEYAPPSLNELQEQAAAEIRRIVQAQAFEVMLLDGVTGSGKTEVYFEAVAEALKQGKQILILVPEIALTDAFLARFEGRFGVRPGEWHSGQAQRYKNLVWRGVATGEVQVVVGARSSLMLPFRDLGLIVVDEEHDGAYKQEDRVIYNARDMSVVRGHLSGFPVILASATPSVESRNNADQGRYKHIRLPSRFGGSGYAGHIPD